MANELDQRFILIENNEGIRVKKADGTETILAKLNATDKVEFESNPEVGGSELQTEAQVDSKILAVETSLQANIDSEASARIAGDADTLSQAQTYTGTQVSALEDYVDQEIAILVAADAATLASANSYTDSQVALAQGNVSAVEAALAQEVLDRQAADNNLQTQINNVLSNVDGASLDSLTEIVAAFQAADASLNGAITALSTGLSAEIDAEETARAAADAILDAEIDALRDTVIGSIYHVNKSGNDSSGTGSSLAPFVTLKKALEVAPVGSVISIGPGLYVEADDFELKPGYHYVAPTDISSAVTVSHLTSTTPIALVMGATAQSTSITGISFTSPISVSQPNVGVGGAVDMLGCSVNATTTVDNSGNSVAIAFRVRDSSLNAAVLTKGPVSNRIMDSFLPSSTTFGDATTPVAQGFSIVKGCVPALGATITANGSSLSLLHSPFDNIAINTLGVASRTFTYDSASQSFNNPVITGTPSVFKLSQAQAIAFVAAVSGNWTSAVTDVKSALDQLASRLKSNEDLDVAQNGRLDALEAVSFQKEKKVVDSTILSSKQITLAFTPKANSLSAFVGRLAMHEGDDFTISGNVVTIIGTLAGAQGIKLNDNLYFNYQK